MPNLNKILFFLLCLGLWSSTTFALGTGPLRSETEKKVYRNYADFLKRGHVPPLTRAVIEGKAPRFYRLLNKLDSVDERDSFGETALVWATYLENRKFVAALLEKGANPNAVHQGGSHALIMAAYQGNIYLSKLLLAYGANLDLQNKNGDTALTVAEKRGHGHLFQVLAKVWLTNHHLPVRD